MKNIDFAKFVALSTSELAFIYSMLTKYGGGGMGLSVEEDQKPNQRQQKNQHNNKRKGKSTSHKKRGKFIPIDKTKPDLYNFDDLLWDTCVDKNFLIFRIMIERLEHNNKNKFKFQDPK